MFAPAENKVLDVDLDALLGPGGHQLPQVHDQVAQAIRRHDLKVHVIVLSHGRDLERFDTTTRLCRSLAPVSHIPGVDVAVSYQGDPVPAALTDSLAGSVRVLAGHPRLTEPTGRVVPQAGKTEHILGCLATLIREPGNPLRRFVVFLDNDYLVYDPVNVLALYAPWALGFTGGAGRPADSRFAGVRFAKGGSLRLVVGPDLIKPVGEKSWTFIDLLDAALARCVPQAPPLREQVPPGFIPTMLGLRDALGPAGVTELEAAVEQVTKHGGRSSRALTLWLASQRDHLVEHWLSRFSFLLHGDQGATLAAWTAMELAPGYGLELSFLLNALFRPGLHTGRIVNAMALPHAHLPKPEADNFAMGVEMFTLLQHLLHGMTSRAPHCQAPDRPAETVAQPRWRHFAATKLGYKPVELTWPVPRVPALYPPLADLEGRHP